jgi:NTE family protein
MAEPVARRDRDDERPVAIVLSGAGARGAYEAGVLAELLPLLVGADRPRIIVGTSAGALNTAMLASAIDQGLDPVAALTTKGWGQISPPKVFASPAVSLVRLAERWVRRPSSAAPGLLDTDVLRATLGAMLPNPRFAAGVGRGSLDAVAVVASSCNAAEAVAFFESPVHPRSKQGLHYEETTLGLDHLMASSAFPLAFPARWVEGPGQGWYIDGGVHLNTPIKPAIDFGASRILVIGGTPFNISQPPLKSIPPNLSDGMGQLLHAMLVDALHEDLRTLAAVNRRLLSSSAPSGPSSPASGHRVIEFCAVNPRDDAMSGVAARTWPSDICSLIRSLGSYPVLGALTSQRQRPGQFLSYLCFAEAFIAYAMACGRCDAKQVVGPSREIPWATT